MLQNARLKSNVIFLIEGRRTGWVRQSPYLWLRFASRRQPFTSGTGYLKNKAAETDRVEAYKQEKAAASAIIYPIVGLMLIAIMLFNWNRIPPENTGLAIGFIVFAALLISYGFFRWYKMRRSG